MNYRIDNQNLFFREEIISIFYMIKDFYMYQLVKVSLERNSFRVALYIVTWIIYFVLWARIRIRKSPTVNSLIESQTLFRIWHSVTGLYSSQDSIWFSIFFEKLMNYIRISLKIGVLYTLYNIIKWRYLILKGEVSFKGPFIYYVDRIFDPPS